ncbi:MAG: hypothetical protein AB1898_18430 [Acidobacteriota bacterium]
MNALPAASRDWHQQFRVRVAFERQLVGVLIRWGLTEFAFDIYSEIEQRISELEAVDSAQEFQRSELPEATRNEIRDRLGEYYQRTRAIPRGRTSHMLLHNELLSGFEKLGSEIAEICKSYFESTRRTITEEQAA